MERAEFETSTLKKIAENRKVKDICLNKLNYVPIIFYLKFRWIEL